MAVQNRASRPIFSRAANSKSVKDYITQLDELLRRNKGGFSAVAEETGSSVPFIVPGRAMKSGVPELPQRKAAELPAPEEYPIQELPPQEEVLGEQTQGGAQDFIESLNSIFGGDSLYLTGQGSTPDGGTILSDGSVAYNDGTVVNQSGETIYAVASLPGGGLKYSDGSVKYIDPSTAGLEGLMSALGLTGQAITQEYGNTGSGLGYNVHGGTDIRTRNLANKAFSLPFEVQVLDVITADSGSPYGNSVLLGLPTGEAIRLSHLADLGQFQAGGTIAPGSYIGTYGNTGNSTAEHLDLEYYNVDGQRSDPATFQGLTNPQYLSQYVQPKQEPIQMQSIPQPKAPQSTPVPQVETPQVSGVDKLKQAYEQAIQPGSTQRTAIGEAVQGVSPIQAELGIGETISQGAEAGKQARIEALNRQPKEYNPYRQLLGNITERVGDVLGVPEGAFSETIAGAPTKRTNVALASEIGGTQPDQVPGIRQNIKDIGADIQAKAGSGIDKLKSVFSKGGAGVNLFSRPNPSDINQKRAVGEESAGSSLLPASFSDARSAKLASAPNDIRDPFFKSGLNEKYGVKDTAGGALSLDLFSPEFFQNPENIQSVFKGTQFEAPATQKYQAFVEEQRRLEEERRRQQENQNQGSPAYTPGGTQGGYVSNAQPTQQQKSNYTYGVQPGTGGKQITTQINNTPVAFDFGTRSSASAQTQSRPQPQQNIFQKAAAGVSNLFKKWFQ